MKIKIKNNEIFIFLEGGNIQFKNEKGEIEKVSKINLEKNDLSFIKKIILDFLNILNLLISKELKKKYSKNLTIIKKSIDLNNPFLISKKIDEKFSDFFSGSTKYIFLPQKEKEFLKYKKSIGDIDFKINEKLESGFYFLGNVIIEPNFLLNLLQTLVNKKLNSKENPNFSYFIIKTVFKRGKTIILAVYNNLLNLNFQVDLELTKFKNFNPDEWSVFSFYSDFNDLSNKIKGVFRLYLLQALLKVHSKERIIYKFDKITKEFSFEKSKEHPITFSSAGFREKIKEIDLKEINYLINFLYFLDKEKNNLKNKNKKSLAKLLRFLFIIKSINFKKRLKKNFLKSFINEFIININSFSNIEIQKYSFLIDENNKANIEKIYSNFNKLKIFLSQEFKNENFFSLKKELIENTKEKDFSFISKIINNIYYFLFSKDNLKIEDYIENLLLFNQLIEKILKEKNIEINSNIKNLKISKIIDSQEDSFKIRRLDLFFKILFPQKNGKEPEQEEINKLNSFIGIISLIKKYKSFYPPIKIRKIFNIFFELCFSLEGDNNKGKIIEKDNLLNDLKVKMSALKYFKNSFRNEIPDSLLKNKIKKIKEYYLKQKILNNQK